ncbi:MAG: ADP-ribosyl-[dinitrogen reductase] glycohydrolase [Bacteroidota bacterium]|jgi:ADP-ribosylglycohydrolase
MLTKEDVYNGIWGLIIGDVLGVPVEFNSRESLSINPVVDLRKDGSHRQPIGTWSDDTSMVLATIDALNYGYDLNSIAQNFMKWKFENKYTPHGRVFDIGFATKMSIERLAKGIDPKVSGEFGEHNNGNGSLMRILPFVFQFYNINDDKLILEKIQEVSSITHAHFRSWFSCYIYTIMGIELLSTKNKYTALDNTIIRVNKTLSKKNYNPAELKLFEKILSKEIIDLGENIIRSSGYVIHSIEASLWCLFQNDNYKDCVLQAVNLGEDTDTTAAITGGLAGILFRLDSAPEQWKESIVKKDEIEIYIENFVKKLNLK